MIEQRLQRRLYEELRYEFEDTALFETALTHRSAGSRNNERLEFLGDGVLNCVIGAAVFKARPTAPEGDLSRLRASLVKESSLTSIAQELSLGDAIRLGAGELKSGGFRRGSILADAVEALIGAIYLDGGFDHARATILGLYARRLENLPDADTLKDPKTRLQEHLQSQNLSLPVYEVTDVSGEAHRQSFRVTCRLADGGQSAEGSGSSRRRAEQDAASHLLQMLHTN